MAPNSYAAANADGYRTLDPPVPDAAPPSTLAAQLVHDIGSSSTARSSRSDETAELKSFFPIIERVHSHPDILKTPQERLDHNNMLIYVYARVALESTKWDDPFANWEHLRAEALKALSFLKVTIQQTPNVLSYCPSPGAFMFRGTEPLWLWLFPKVLGMLGRSQCQVLAPVIQDLFRLILKLAPESGIPDLVSMFSRYLREILDEILDVLRGQAFNHPGKDVVLNLQLPPPRLLSAMLSTERVSLAQLTFTAINVAQALHYADNLVHLVLYPILAANSLSYKIPTVGDSLPWALDFLLSYHDVRGHWRSLIPTHLLLPLKSILDLSVALGDESSVGDDLQDKALYILTLMCIDWADRLQSMPQDLDVAETGDTFSQAFIRLCKAAQSPSAKNLRHLIQEHLLPALDKAMKETPLPRLGSDFYRACSLLRHIVSDPVPPACPADLHFSNFSSVELGNVVKDLGLVFDNKSAEREPKRRRIIEPEVSPQLLKVTGQILQALNYGDESTALGFSEICQTFLNRYPELKDDESSFIIDRLAFVCCAVDKTLELGDEISTSQRDLISRCQLCESKVADGDINCPYQEPKALVLHVFSEIINLPSFQQSKTPRVVAMVALRRLVSHSNNTEFLDLETSTLGHWCLQSLHSSNRELRIAAGRTLAVFLRQKCKIDPQIIHKNVANVLGVLKQLSDNDIPSLNETCVMTWGQVGRVVSDEELNLVLVTLVDYLGHKNSVVSAFAFNEIANLAAARGVTPPALFEPFWRSLGFIVVKDLIAKPQIIQSVAELLRVSVKEVLKLTQKYSLPWLVLNKKKDIIKRIAEACNKNDASQICVDSTNLSSILAFLLVQDVDNVEENTMALLRFVSPHFDNASLAELFRAEPLLIPMELFMLAAEGDDGRKIRVRNALTLMATLIQGSKHTKKGSSIIGRLIEDQVLGLMARFSETIREINPVEEKKRGIRAIAEMLRTCGSYTRIGRAHIATCLLSSLAQSELRPDAFSCWVTLLRHMDEEDIEALLETTFFVITHYWSTLDTSAREEGRSILSFLIDQHGGLLKKMISKLPSLAHLEGLAELDERLSKLRPSLDTNVAFALFAERIRHENSGVVLQALRELAAYLRPHQAYLQTSSISEKPDEVISIFTRALLDCAAKYNGAQMDVTRLCAECIGLVGCLDSNRVEAVRDVPKFVVVANFQDNQETTDFAVFLLENVLIRTFLSTSDMRLQAYLSYAMQELLKRCNFPDAYRNPQEHGASAVLDKWKAMSDTSREVLTPFLTSRYMLTPLPQTPAKYPIFNPRKGYHNWLRTIVVDLLSQPQNSYASLIFEPLSRVIKVKDISVAEFLLPYLVVHIVLGEDGDLLAKQVTNELKLILEYELSPDSSYAEKEDMKLLCGAVFNIVDYSMRWVQKRNSFMGQKLPEVIASALQKGNRVQKMLESIPAELISQRAIECKEYSRALFHLEQFAREWPESNSGSPVPGPLLQKLQDIYAQIDDPDGLEGISAQLSAIDISHQVLSHRKAGRWTAAQSWYEIKLAEDPTNVETQLDLLTCLKESGQYDVLLNYVDGMTAMSESRSKITPFALEAFWATYRWSSMEKFLSPLGENERFEDFNTGVAELLRRLRASPEANIGVAEGIGILRDQLSAAMTYSTTSSLHAAHEVMLRCHVLTELEMISGVSGYSELDHKTIMATLNRRLEMLGAYVNDKQYVLGLRRAVMELKKPFNFETFDISSLWLASAKLARKSGAMHQSFNAVLHASQLGDGSATLENARLLWKDGHNRKAIQVLQGAIAGNALHVRNMATETMSASRAPAAPHNLITAKAHLLLAKWLDAAGQTNASALREKYQLAAKTYPQWEKGHYYLGRHYKKLMEFEMTLKMDDQSDEYLTGEMAKLVVENYMRCLHYGTKYLHQALPRILTLWLDMGANLDKGPDHRIAITKELYYRRERILEALHQFLQRHIQKMPAYIFYTALPQIVARITHPNQSVFDILETIIIKVVDAHPQQSLWSLFMAMTSNTTTKRQARGKGIIKKLQDLKTRAPTGHEMRTFMRMGEKFASQLIRACHAGDFPNNRSTKANLARDLDFNQKCLPCPLVVPVETFLTATLPTLTESIRKHKAFSRDVVTIHEFLDEILVLGSLAKPRRLTARGTDGKLYNLLLKPNDDMRTDQRLMEFNGIINRALKKDSETSKRQLYIKTYAVTPLNEECGIIEWVDGLKTLREILLNIYKTKGININYGLIANMMKEAMASEENTVIWTEQIVPMFPAVLPTWFVQQFPSPNLWFAARLKYTRSCAVMSMVGTILGLGDRHGENILLEEGNGGVFHVDFNCLFDKGHTFAQPEKVPFRLTHNMVAAMGMYGYEGPFRTCSELTLTILRQQEETLMSILEAFIYDPTLDLQKDKRKRGGVKLSPTNVVESIRRKIKGLLPDESIPLGVEGQVEELIQQAVSARNLTSMYIGWCPFF